MEQADGLNIMHGRKFLDYMLPELPRFSVDGSCLETCTIYEFFECSFLSHTCQPFRDVSNLRNDILAERYERTLSRLEQITRAGYLGKVQWECEFDDAGIVRPELYAHPIVQQIPLCNRDAVYGG